MLKRMLKRNMRQPLPALAVILFSAVLSVVLCHLHRAGEEELRSFEEAFASVPVYFKITDLDGSKPKTTDGIEGWIVDLFTDQGLKPTLDPYVKELHVRVPYYSVQQYYMATDIWGSPAVEKYHTIDVVGITSTRVAEELTEGWGGSIHWYEGYDESILQSEEFVCIVPELLKDEVELELGFPYKHFSDNFNKEPLIDRHSFKVAGYYTDPGNSDFYIPYLTMERIHAGLGKSKTIEELGAILKDNNDLAALRETASQWFATPNPAGALTPWGKFDFDYYLYALDIDDTMLQNLSANIKNTMRMNRLVAAVVFALSAGAGFLTGFLVIRSRRLEMTLMRTLGTPNGSVFAKLALEQLLCIVIGIAFGGGYTLWQPIGQLALFGGIYAIGLVTALFIFMRRNLLSTMKEDE